MAVVDYVGGESGLLQRNVQRIASAHAQPMAPMRSFLTLGLGLEKFKSGAQVALGAVVGHSAHEFVRHVRAWWQPCRDINRWPAPVALVGQFRSLIFDPVVSIPTIHE